MSVLQAISSTYSHKKNPPPKQPNCYLVYCISRINGLYKEKKHKFTEAHKSALLLLIKDFNLNGTKSLSKVNEHKEKLLWIHFEKTLRKLGYNHDLKIEEIIKLLQYTFKERTSRL